MSIILTIYSHFAAAPPPPQIIEHTKILPAGLPQATADTGTLQRILNIVLNIIGALALLMITVSGLRYILSAGNPEKASKARDGIIYGLVGLVIAISAEAIVAFVVNRL